MRRFIPSRFFEPGAAVVLGALLALLALSGGCALKTGATPCGDGWCPDGYECADRSGGLFECIVVTCGDGIKDPVEACDDGAGNSDILPNACRTNCQRAHCGDGVVDLDEQCDDGEDGNSDTEVDACRTDC
ncbi:MAG: hypothetical protein ABI333_01775, partial [bacterium]